MGLHGDMNNRVDNTLKLLIQPNVEENDLMHHISHDLNSHIRQSSAESD